MNLAVRVPPGCAARHLSIAFSGKDGIAVSINKFGKVLERNHEEEAEQQENHRALPGREKYGGTLYHTGRCLMKVEMRDLRVVLFALHVAAAQGATPDPQGARTRALWDAVLPLSLPEPGDPPLPESWAALVKLSEMYAQLVDQPSDSHLNTRRDTVAGPVGDTRDSKFIWH